jgi:protein tyrosine phosphatase (PTP) superfamily phosphohydrolase (DUF442 family)
LVDAGLELQFQKAQRAFHYDRTGTLASFECGTMDQITDDIWIGSSTEAKDLDSLRREGIRSILCLDGCLLGKKAEHLGVNSIEVVELVDGRGNKPEVFLRAVGLLKKLKTKHSPVLVHCHSGQSRSAAVVCKFFMKEEGASLGQAMKRITSKRKVVIVAGLQEALDF